MATASLTTSPTTLDAGSAASVWIRNTGSTRVTVVNGSQKTYLRASRDMNVVPTGTVTVYVSAIDGGTGAITYDVSTSATTAPGRVGTIDLAPGTVIDGGTP